MGQIPDRIVDVEGSELYRFASHRVNPWWLVAEEGLAVTFPESVTDVNDMLRRAHLDTITVETVTPVWPGITDLGTTNVQGIASFDSRTGIRTLHGTASSKYTLRTPKEILSWANFGPHDGAEWETAGMMGAVIFGSVALDREIVLDPSGVSDVVKLYMLVLGSLDGTQANRGVLTGIRGVCKNTCDMAFAGLRKDHSNGFRYKSIGDVSARVRAWYLARASAEDQADALEREAKKLFETPVSDSEFMDHIVPAMWPVPDAGAKGAVTRYGNKLELVQGYWITPENAGIRRTGWGAVSALTEYSQWQRQARPGLQGTIAFARAAMGLDAIAKAERQKALDVVYAYVKSR